MVLKKIFIIFLLLILTIGAVNASENIDSLQTLDADANSQNELIQISENNYEISDANYDNYFDSDGNLNNNISDGDTIKLGNLTNKLLTIDKNLTITSITPKDTLTNSMIKLIQGGDNSIINGIKIINNKNTTFTTAIELNKVNNITIFNLTLISSQPIKYNLLINSSNNVNISGSEFIIKNGPELTNIYYTPDSLNVSITDCIIKSGSSTIIEANDLTKIEKNASKFEAKFSNMFQPLINRAVTFKINGAEYTRTTDSEGVARIAINLVPGNYTIESIDPLTGASKNNKITVLPRIIENYDLEKYYQNDSQYIIKVLDDMGNPAKANETVTFNINGAFYERKTNETGYAKLNINLNPGDYVITANYKNCEASNKIKVLSVIVDNHDLEKYYKNDSQYIIKILDGEGNPAKANETVIFNINGVFYNRTVNETGHVKLNINLQAGDYIITADYKGCQVSNNIKVKPILSADNLTKKYGEDTPFKAKLVDGEGKALADTNVTFNINGVLYNRTTDSDGIAKLNINLISGEYIITSGYDGCYISNKITITN